MAKKMLRKLCFFTYYNFRKMDMKTDLSSHLRFFWYLILQFHWHGAVSIFVELNVIFLVSRWHFHQDGIVHEILDSLFLTTWFLFRIIVFPVLLIFYSYEYIRYSHSLGNVWLNIVLLAPILQVIGVTDNVKNAFLVFQ